MKDSLRAIERYSGLRSAELNQIRRQEPKRGRTAAERKRIRGYREAVKARRLSASYRVRLKNWDRLEAVAECGANEQKHEALRPLSRYRETRRIGHCRIANTR